MILEQFYAMSSCTPSRSALLTGVHPAHNGLYHSSVGTWTPVRLGCELLLLLRLYYDYYYYYYYYHYHCFDSRPPPSSRCRSTTPHAAAAAQGGRAVGLSRTASASGTSATTIARRSDVAPASTSSHGYFVVHAVLLHVGDYGLCVDGVSCFEDFNWNGAPLHRESGKLDRALRRGALVDVVAAHDASKPLTTTSRRAARATATRRRAICSS